MTRRLSLAWLALLLGACLSPTLPLPPPEAPENITAGEDGVWDVRGACQPGSLVLVKNLNTGVIVGTEDDQHTGRYFLQVEAEACDVAEVFEVRGEDLSDVTQFRIEPTTNGVPDDPEACK